MPINNRKYSKHTHFPVGTQDHLSTSHIPPSYYCGPARKTMSRATPPLDVREALASAKTYTGLLVTTEVTHSIPQLWLPLA